jgi:hypothetical protein
MAARVCSDHERRCDDVLSEGSQRNALARRKDALFMHDFATDMLFL